MQPQLPTYPGNLAPLAACQVIDGRSSGAHREQLPEVGTAAARELAWDGQRLKRWQFDFMLHLSLGLSIGSHFFRVIKSAILIATYTHAAH